MAKSRRRAADRRRAKSGRSTGGTQRSGSPRLSTVVGIATGMFTLRDQVFPRESACW